MLRDKSSATDSVVRTPSRMSRRTSGFILGILYPEGFVSNRDYYATPTAKDVPQEIGFKVRISLSKCHLL
jgi:hypothetical protein